MAAMPRYPALAAAMRAYLGQHQISVAELGRRLGVSDSAPHPWLAGRGAPGPALRAKVSALLGVSVTGLMGKGDPGAVVVRPAPGPVSVVPAVHDVWQLAFRSDGTARIKLDVTLPVERAMPIIRLLMDVGLVADQGSEG